LVRNLTEYLSFIEPLILIVVGALIGFLSSIGFDSWKERRSIEELKKRIIQELEIVKAKIESDVKSKTVNAQCYSTSEIYHYLKEDLIRKLDVKAFNAIELAYIKIDSLRTPIPEPAYVSTVVAWKNEKDHFEEMIKTYRKRFEDTVKTINGTIAILN